MGVLGEGCGLSAGWRLGVRVGVRGEELGVGGEGYRLGAHLVPPSRPAHPGWAEHAALAPLLPSGSGHGIESLGRHLRCLGLMEKVGSGITPLGGAKGLALALISYSLSSNWLGLGRGLGLGPARADPNPNPKWTPNPKR